MNTKAQAFFIHFDDSQEVCHLGAAVILDDDFMAVAGFCGVMPAVVGQRLIELARGNGVQIEQVKSEGPETVFALVWGNFPVRGMWDLISFGIAESTTKAVINALSEAAELPDDLNDLLGPERK